MTLVLAAVSGPTHQMTPGWQAFFYALAVFLFVIAFVISLLGQPRPSARAWNWVALGLAFGFFVFFWNALAAA